MARTKRSLSWPVAALITATTTNPKITRVNNLIRKACDKILPVSLWQVDHPLSFTRSKTSFISLTTKKHSIYLPTLPFHNPNIPFNSTINCRCSKHTRFSSNRFTESHSTGEKIKQLEPENKKQKEKHS